MLQPCWRRWRAYFTSGSSALYLLAYSLFYFYTRLYIKRWVPMVMYFCYMTMISLSFFCLTGTIGFYGAHLHSINHELVCSWLPVSLLLHEPCVALAPDVCIAGMVGM